MPTRRDALRRIGLASAAALVEPGLAAVQPSAFDGGQAGEPRVIEDVRLRWCPPGRFTMGSPPTEPDRRADEAQVEVTLTRGFWMAAFETTQGQWQRIAGAFPDKPPTEAFGIGEAFPLYWVNYAEAEGFCRALTERARRASAIPANAEFRLPTEAQWEYACRAGTTTATAFGDRVRRGDANFKIDPRLDGDGPPSPGRATPAGAFRANAWGLHDMYGNVFEWCRDWYHAHAAGRRRSRRAGEGGAEPRRQLLAGPPRRRVERRSATGAAPRCACATSRSATPITSGSASSSSRSEEWWVALNDAQVKIGCEVEPPPCLKGRAFTGGRPTREDAVVPLNPASMSLALLGLLTIVSVLAAIMSRRVTPLVALIALPVLAALIGGFGLQTGAFAVAGIKETAPVAAMFVFAILFFGVMTDAGLLDPIVGGVLRAVGHAPDPHRDRLGAAGAGRAPGRLRRGDVPRDGAGDAAALRSPRARSPRAGLRRVAGRGRELPAVDGAGAARLRGAADPDRDAVRAADPRAGGGPRVRVHGRLVPGPARRPAARVLARCAGARPSPRRASSPRPSGRCGGPDASGSTCC